MLIDGQKPSVPKGFPDRSYCVKGLARDWYLKLISASRQDISPQLRRYIKEQIDELESRHIHLSPHGKIDVDKEFLEDAQKRLPRTPYNIGSKTNNLKSKIELHDTRIDDREDYIAREIRRNLKNDNEGS